MKKFLIIISLAGVAGTSCNNDEPVNTECIDSIAVDTSRGACEETLSFTSEASFVENATTLSITANNIPSHLVGLFGDTPGSLNPNAVREQNSNYSITNSPSQAASKTYLLADNGPAYSFGILTNGVEVDPVAAEPWPHEGIMNPNVNWDWNLEATMVQIGLDCNSAHVQPTGKYHYHGAPTLFLEEENITNTRMTMIGYAADGFPLYYKYGYSDANDGGSNVVELASSYVLKTGDRPGDGVSAPCGTYSGAYSSDFEYITGLGDLDECNGRTGVTPDFPNGTYYYVLTDDFPNIPRCFVGTPSNDFRIQ
jgi:hypothetical protein